MGEFNKSLLKGEIPYPTQRKFNLKDWDNSFNSFSQKDEDDERIYSAGKWVFNKLAFIREQIKDLKFNSLQKEEALQCLFGFVNRDVSILTEMQKEMKPENEILAISYLNKKIKFNDISPELSVVDKFESTVEAVKYPLIQLFHSNDFPNKKSKSLCDIELLNSYKKIINYGQYYLIIEGIWGKCLWRKYSIEPKEKYDLIKIPVDRDTKVEAISKFRLDSLIVESAFQAIKMWKNDLSEELKKTLIDINVVRNIVGSGKTKQYILNKYTYDEESPPSSFIAELQAHELYFNKLLNLPVPKIPSITLRVLFKVWHLFFSLADILKDRLPQDTGVFKISKLKMFSTQIKKNDLVNLISKSISVNSSDSKKIIEIFTYNGNNEDELWTKPFVEYKERLYFIYGTLLMPNLLRSLESWIKCGGFDLSERGDLFENYVRIEISDSLKNSKIIKDAGVFPNSITIPGDGKNEEIDLVFWMKNKFIIGELKCVLFPTSPLEDYRYNDRLLEASIQIQRKQKAVEKHKKEFLDQLSLTEIIDETKIEIVPIILTNLQLGSGKIIDSIPVTDLLLLNKYLSDGEMSLFVERSMHSDDKVNTIHKFYEDEQQAIDNFDNFVKNPPLLLLYGSFLKKNINQFLIGNDEDKPYVEEFLEVVIE
ncbi:MAG: hypothetical protein KF816_02890 [Melioribacteraceae bacterium]|nr:hypothetical protein [Melioribacteraceae bacterium]